MRLALLLLEYQLLDITLLELAERGLPALGVRLESLDHQPVIEVQGELQRVTLPEQVVLRQVVLLCQLRKESSDELLTELG